MPFVNINLRKKKNTFVVPEEAQIPSITVSLNSSRNSLETELIEEVLEKLDLTKAENASTLTKTHFFNSVLNLQEKSPDFTKIDDEKDKKSFLNLRIQSATSKESEKPKRKTTFDGLPIYNVIFYSAIDVGIFWVFFFVFLWSFDLIFLLLLRSYFIQLLFV